MVRKFCNQTFHIYEIILSIVLKRVFYKFRFGNLVYFGHKRRVVFECIHSHRYCKWQSRVYYRSTWNYNTMTALAFVLLSCGCHLAIVTAVCPSIDYLAIIDADWFPEYAFTWLVCDTINTCHGVRVTETGYHVLTLHLFHSSMALTVLFMVLCVLIIVPTVFDWAYLLSNYVWSYNLFRCTASLQQYGPLMPQNCRKQHLVVTYLRTSRRTLLRLFADSFN